MENQQKKSRFSDGSRISTGGMYSEKLASAGTVRRSAPALKKPAQQAAPAAAKKPAKRKHRANKARKARRKVNIKRILIASLAVLAAAAIAGGVIWAVHSYKNRTIHMLPEIRDIEAEGEFAAEVGE